MTDSLLWLWAGVSVVTALGVAWVAFRPKGDANASIPTPQPVHYRPMFAGFGRNLVESSVTFVSAAALSAGIGKKYGITRVELAHANGLGTGAGLRTGQRLRVPSPKGKGQPVSNPASGGLGSPGTAAA